MTEALTKFLEDARAWCAGHMWLPRALLLAYLVYAELRLLFADEAWTWFSGITFAFHEMGHLIFSFAGHFLGSLMGSGLQLLIPIIVIIVFYRQEDYFGMAVGAFWLSFSLFDVARYVADARMMELPLIGFTDEPEHDWNYLLSTVGLLNFDKAIAFLMRVIAFAIGVAATWFAAWLLVVMFKSPRRARGFAR